MRIIKYFFEEPTRLGDQSSADQRSRLHYRGHLAASDLEGGVTGGSILDDALAAKMLARVLEGPIWFSNRVTGQEDVSLSLLTNHRDIVRALTTMGSESVMMLGVDPSDELVDALKPDRDGSPSWQAIAGLLDRKCTLVFPEQAQMGHDWSVFSPKPLSESFREAMADLPENTRGFVIPYGEARGEAKFFFEQDDIELFAKHEVR